MTISALVLAEAPTKLWGLSSSERLRRQLKEIGGVIGPGPEASLPASGQVLLLNGSYLFEIRTLQGLLARPDSMLFAPADGRPAAAFVDAARARETMDFLAQPGASMPAGLHALHPGDLAAFNRALRSVHPPLLEIITEARHEELENLLYGHAYRGITDFVTKFLWPRPARRLVHWCARLGLSPNTVTTAGLLLVVAACWYFRHGEYSVGLLAGWIMILLDTVDGKLARVTIQSSKFGNLYDHAIDLVHPPFWYIYWGLSLSAVPAFAGLDFPAQCWLLVIAYGAGRLVELLFYGLGDCGIYTWRPLDAWFRLITARRNPCLILLTLSVLIGRPDWGFLWVVIWSALTTAFLLLRLLHGLVVRLTSGPLTSWLKVENVASGPHARSFRIFGRTGGAFRA
ncbi:MAG: CDP-alcohol phosphatidyltransferase family protein [Lysobacterales bacterium]